MKNDVRTNPRSQIAWGLYNFGLLIGVKHTRRYAIEEVERLTGEPWSKAKRYMEVHKVRVEVYRP